MTSKTPQYEMSEILPTHIIGKHLSPHIEVPVIPGRCRMCGASDVPGYPSSQILSAGFMDGAYLSGGQDTHICAYCAACIGYGQERTKFIKNSSFLATPSALRLLKREDLWEVLVVTAYDITEPFVIGVTYAHKKHISFKAKTNLPDDPGKFWVQTENDTVWVDIPVMSDAIEIMQKWYTVCNPTAAQPTFFTKADILSGCTNYKRIEEYGTMRYMEENQVLQRFRGAVCLELLTHALNKSALNAEHAAEIPVLTSNFFTAPIAKPIEPVIGTQQQLSLF